MYVCDFVHIRLLPAAAIEIFENVTFTANWLLASHFLMLAVGVLFELAVGLSFNLNKWLKSNIMADEKLRVS